MEVLLWISGILGFVATLPYLRDIIISRNTENPVKPIKISWFIWALLDTLVVLNSLDLDKDYLEIALPISYALGAVLVFLLWRLSSYHHVCKMCKSTNIIPLDSPMGKKKLAEFHN